jgi:hypothetical protein
MILPYLDNVMYRVRHWAHNSSDPDFGRMADVEETTDLGQADIISSKQKHGFAFVMLGDSGLFGAVPDDNMHTPVLDIDVPAQLVPSSTPGNHHLFLDVPMTWEQYQKLIDVMAEVGILQPGYVLASKARGFTAVRLPWRKKGPNDDALSVPLLRKPKLPRRDGWQV